MARLAGASYEAVAKEARLRPDAWVSLRTNASPNLATRVKSGEIAAFPAPYYEARTRTPANGGEGRDVEVRFVTDDRPETISLIEFVEIMSDPELGPEIHRLLAQYRQRKLLRG